jgi:hypothetical protein
MDYRIFRNHINPKNPPKPVGSSETVANHDSDRKMILKAHVEIKQ